MFPSPCRGLIFLTCCSTTMQYHPGVSVPLQGTYLPYAMITLIILTNSVSVPLQGTYLPYDFNVEFTAFLIVSVPLQGTYLPYPVRAIHEFPYVSTALCVGKRK